MRRKYAYDVLVDVLIRKRHAHLVLKELDLPREDQAFVSALVYATLQNRLYLEYQIEDLVDNKLPQEVRVVLLMGLAQYFKMDKIPEYALVSESVDLVKKTPVRRFSGLVNAVLKKAIKRGERPIEGSALDQASITYSMPKWILKLLSKQYSESFALDYARYCQEIKPVYVRENTLKTMPLEYRDLFDDNGIAKPELFQSDALKESYVIVQDKNSQEVVKWMDLKADMNVLDFCCGPGTKTTQIAAVLENTGHIDGVELHASRAQETVDLLARSHVTNAHIHVADARTYSSKMRYDRILIDAPCSGLGVLSHKHDLRYNIQPTDLDDLLEVQKEILENASAHLEIDGIMVYATCTLNKKENEKQVAAFLENHDNFKLLQEETLDPIITQGDGFYIAKLQRTC